MSIQFKQVNYIYEPGTPFQTQALTDISFEIKRGEYIGLIGHTGSGKSTLVQLMNGLLTASSGQILIDEIDLMAKSTTLSDIRKKVGLVFQYPEYQLFEPTIYEDVAFGPKNLKLNAQEIERRVVLALEAVNIDVAQAKQTSPFQISGGQQRRVAIAGILAMQPDVLILDEPAAGLDPAGRRDILSLIEKQHNQFERSTILISHSMEDVAKYVDRIMVIAAGKIVYFDTPSKIFEQRQALRQIGLDVPETTKIVETLQARGIPLDSAIYDERQLVDALVQYLGGQG